jgi:predicted O-linked N-acetylglucosamine transferase (SPINDLY family)
MNIPELMRQAFAYHQAGDLLYAESVYRKILYAKPSQPDALHYLGLILCLKGDIDEGRKLLDRSLKLQPASSAFSANYAKTLFEAGDYESAMRLAKKAIALDPKCESAYCVLADVMMIKGDFPSALKFCREAVRVGNRSAMILNNVTVLHLQLQQPQLAVEAAKFALTHHPENRDTVYQLGVALTAAGEFEEAQSRLSLSLEMFPDDIRLLLQLAKTEYYLAGHIGESVKHFERVLEADPANVDALTHLGAASSLKCDFAAARNYFDRALSVQPDSFEAFTAMLLTFQYDPHLTDEAIYDAHLKCGRAIEAASKSEPNFVETAVVVDPERPLKLGYVSPDFYGHPVMKFFLPILENHNQKLFEVVAYRTGGNADEYTQKLEDLASAVVDCRAMSNSELLEKIRGDQIDVLFDLSGHSAGNRLAVFAARAAPIQITWIGYPGTTGLSSMDYRITDAMLDPKGMTDRWHTEKLLRLTGSAASFSPPEDSPDVGPLPAMLSGRFTFGCLNSPKKINDEVIGVWSEVLHQVPGSTFVLGNLDDAEISERIAKSFGGHGIERGRLRKLKRLPLREYLEVHNDIDLMLDPFPYNGGTSTVYSLWMGVPVLTLAGTRTSSRLGVTWLHSVGLETYITNTMEDYKRGAISIAGNYVQLAQDRAALRSRFLNGAIGDARRTVQDLESQIRRIWREYCSQRQPTSSA